MATEGELQHQQELSETLTKFRSLVASQGWAALLEIARIQRDSRRRQAIMTPLESTGKITEQQWLLGEACGIDTIMNIPQSIIDATAAERDAFNATQPPEEGDESVTE